MPQTTLSDEQIFGSAGLILTGLLTEVNGGSAPGEFTPSDFNNVGNILVVALAQLTCMSHAFMRPELVEQLIELYRGNVELIGDSFDISKAAYNAKNN